MLSECLEYDDCMASMAIWGNTETLCFLFKFIIVATMNNSSNKFTHAGTNRFY